MTLRRALFYDAPAVMTDADAPFTLVFVGYADPALRDRAIAYEDEVLPLLSQHGARLLYRGRNPNAEDGIGPVEVHLIWFPHRRALASYLADERRAALIRKHGEVFTCKHAVEMDTIVGDGLRG